MFLCRNQKTKSEKPTVVITYASQTGTAQDIAQSIHAECNERDIKAKVLSLNELGLMNISSGKTPLLIAVVSSTGDGDPPDNSNNFFKSMKDAKRDASKGAMLEGVRFTCLGLGDSNYTSFMAVPIRFKKGCDAFGAQRFYDCREVDEVEGLEDLVEEWIEGLWDPLTAALSQLTSEDATLTKTSSTSSDLTRRLSESLKLDSASDSLKDFHLPSDWEIQGVPAMPVLSISILLSSIEPPHDRSEKSREPPYSPTNRYSASLVHWKRLTAEPSDREVYLVTFDLGESGLNFSPGDSLGILPQNDPVLVEALLQRLDLNGDQTVTIKSLEGSTKEMPHIKDHSTVRELLLRSLEICSVLKKTVLRFLAGHCNDAEDSLKLKFLVSKSGRDAYQKFMTSAKASLMDVLHSFPSCKPPLSGLVELLPPLAPRMYSLACSQRVHQKEAQIAFSLARYSTPYGERTGVATGYLKRCLYSKTSPISVDVCIRSGGSFRLPPDLTRPLILIGPGTGVAPFIGFLEEKRELLKDWSESIGPCWLFFGCRREDEDYLFKTELEAMQREGLLTHYHVAFSRQSDQKVYVQDLMLIQSEQLYHDIFGSNGFVFVCGDGTAMAQDVHRCLLQILMRHGHLDEIEAKDRLSQMLTNLSYVKDIWS